MQTADEKYEDLWSGLESEFEETEPSPLNLDLSRVPNRQRTIGVANLQSLFSGFYPAFILCMVAILLGVKGGTPGFAVIGTCLLALPLSAIFSVVLRGPRRHLGYYLFTALAVGGSTELFLVLSEWTFAQVFDPPVERATFVTSLQNGMERFFSFSHWGIYLLLGLGVSYVVKHAQHRAPWMDYPPAGGARKSLAVVLLATPLLLPLICLITGTIMESRVRWYQWSVHDSPEVYQSEYLTAFPEVDSEWSRVYKDWIRSTSGETDQDLLLNTSAPELNKVERSYLAIAASAEPRLGWTGNHRELLESLLLTRRKELEHPYQVADAILQAAMVHHSFGGDDPALLSQWQFFLEELRKANLEPSDARRLLHRIEQYDLKARAPWREADDYVAVLATIRSPYGTGIDPEPMKLFGVPFNNSPEQLYFSHHVRYVTDGWLALRRDWYSQTPEEQIAEIRKQRGSQDQVLSWMSARCFEYEMQPLWRAAAVITACKIHKLENGVWPQSLSEVSSLLWFLARDPESWKEPAPTEFVVTPSAEGLTIQDKVSGRSWSLK